MSDQKVGLSRGSAKHKQFVQNEANNYVVEAFIDVSAVEPGNGLPAAADGQQYLVDSGASSALAGWGTISGLQDKDVIHYRASTNEWIRVFAAAVGEEGAKVYDKDSDTIFAFDGADWNVASGAGGGAKNFAQKQATGYKVGDLTTGNSATFGDSGTLNGVLSIDQTAPLDGKKSFQYTTGGSSENDWFYYTVDIDSYARGGVLAFVFDYLWDGEQPLQVKILDELGNELTTELNQITNTDNINKNSKNSRTVFVQAQDQATVRVGFQVPAGVTAGKIFKWDNLLVSDDIGVIGSGGRRLEQFIRHSGSTSNWDTVTAGGAGPSASTLFRWDNSLVFEGDNLLTEDFITGSQGTKLVAQQDCTVSGSLRCFTSGTSQAASYVFLVGPNGNPSITTNNNGLDPEGSSVAQATFSYKMKKGQEIWFGYTGTPQPNFGLDVVATAEEEQTRFLQVPNGEKLKDSFSARIDAAGNILSTSANFIQSVNSSGGNFTITWVPGFFSETPAVTAISDYTTGSNSITEIDQVNTTDCIIYTRNLTDSAAVASDINIIVHRQGNDVAPDIVGVPVSIQGQTHEQDSYIRLGGGNNRGSSGAGTYYHRFDGILEAGGNALSYQDSATDGASITVNENGLYHVQWTGDFTAAANFGIVKNDFTSQIISNTPALNLLCNAQSFSNGARENVANQVYLNKGDVIRFKSDGLHNDGGGGDNVIIASVTKIGTQPLLDGGVVESPGSFIRVNTTVATAGGGQDLTYANIDSQIDNGDFTYDAATGKFTVINSGHYAFTVFDECNTGQSELTILLNNSYALAKQNHNEAYFGRVNASWSGWLSEGDVIHAYNSNTRPSGGARGAEFAKRDNIQQFTSRVYKEDPIAWQRKTLSTNISSSIVLTDLSFNNLEPGKTYRISAQADFTINPSRSGDGLFVSHDGAEIMRITESQQNATSERFSGGNSVIFTATATTIVTSIVIQGTMYANTTWAILEELPFHAQTSKWT